MANIVGLNRRLVLASAAVALLAPGAALAAPENALPAQPDAAEALAQERAQATREGKRVLVSFYASWCGWCVPMNAVLEDRAARPILERHFRLIHMRALEHSPARRAQQWVNADRIYHNYATDEDGLPFIVILNEDGTSLVSSRSPVNNQSIGFPMSAAELSWFQTMLRTGAPGLTADELAAVRDACVRNA